MQSDANSDSSRVRSMFKLMRPGHWVKNLLVFVPFVFSGQMTDASKALTCLIGFVAFSLVASTVYIVNDLMDAENDRRHPVKRNRPIASGAVSERAAAALSALLVVLAVACSVIIGSLQAAAVLAFYLVMNVAYSAGLKRVAIVDVVILALGYPLRVFYGGLVCDIAISSWLYLTLITASLYLGLGKRWGEMVSVGAEGQTRAVLRLYTEGFLEKNMYMFLGLTNVFYALWARDAAQGMLITVPLVMIIFLRYSFDLERNRGYDGDPMSVLLGDKVLVALAALFAAAVLCVLYAAPSVSLFI